MYRLTVELKEGGDTVFEKTVSHIHTTNFLLVRSMDLGEVEIDQRVIKRVRIGLGSEEETKPSRLRGLLQLNEGS